MKFILAVSVAAVLMFHVEQSAAQTMDVTAMMTSPQEGVTGPDSRTFGYGLAATYAFTGAHENIHLIGSLQYHDHGITYDRWNGNVEDVDNDKDLFVGGGVRLTHWGLYAQGLLGFIQKRDPGIQKNNDTKVAGYAGWGYQPRAVGVAGGWYFSEFGIQYGLGLNVRF